MVIDMVIDMVINMVINMRNGWKNMVIKETQVAGHWKLT